MLLQQIKKFSILQETEKVSDVVYTAKIFSHNQDFCFYPIKKQTRNYYEVVPLKLPTYNMRPLQKIIFWLFPILEFLERFYALNFKNHSSGSIIHDILFLAV